MLPKRSFPRGESRCTSPTWSTVVIGSMNFMRSFKIHDFHWFHWFSLIFIGFHLLWWHLESGCYWTKPKTQDRVEKWGQTFSNASQTFISEGKKSLLQSDMIYRHDRLYAFHQNHWFSLIFIESGIYMVYIAIYVSKKTRKTWKVKSHFSKMLPKNTFLRGESRCACLTRPIAMLGSANFMKIQKTKKIAVSCTHIGGSSHKE